MSAGSSRKTKALAPQIPQEHNRLDAPGPFRGSANPWCTVSNVKTSEHTPSSVLDGQANLMRQTSQPGTLGGPANPTMQTNQPQYPAQANLTKPTNLQQQSEHAEDLIKLESTNPMPTPIPMGNNSVHSQLGSLDGSAQRQPPDYQPPPSYPHPAPIVAIGNPGSGKSTILNALAGELLFGSGISLGCGLTSQLDEKANANGRKFMDTPGMADDTYNQAAGEALKKVFHRGGRMKVLFFITQEAGRIVSQDVTTMKLVLESVPEIGQNYGVIVNKIPRNVLSQLSEGETYLKLLLSLYAGIKDEFKHDNVLLLPLNAKLSNMDNAILHPSHIHQDLMEFINTKIPDANITPGKINEIRVDDFEQLNKQVENLQSELKKNRERQTAETEKLLTELEKEKLKEREELQKMKKTIEDKEEKMRGLEQKSEAENMKEEIINERKQEMHDQIIVLKIEVKQKKAKISKNYKPFNFIDFCKKKMQGAC